MVKICSIEGCGKKTKGGQLCSAHAHRLRRYGDPLAHIDRAHTAQQFIADLLASNTDECVTWPYTRGRDGRGGVTVAGKVYKASRYVCLVAHGEPPTPDHEAAHSCGKGNDGCVTPKHLSWKTPKENAADKVLHGTDNQGHRHGMAKLTEENVIEIRRLGSFMYHKDIAAQFDISRRYVGDILACVAWKHVA